MVGIAPRLSPYSRVGLENPPWFHCLFAGGASVFVGGLLIKDSSGEKS